MKAGSNVSIAPTKIHRFLIFPSPLLCRLT